ncbi:MAG: glucose-6-phosphate dehydrogenase [Chlamydiota bacterium]
MALPAKESLSSQSFVIFGATGDLTKRKLIPALLHLYEKNVLPDSFLCISVGRREMDRAQFLKEVTLLLDEKDRELWDSFSQKIIYLSGSFEESSTYTRLSKLLESRPGDRLFYLATPPTSFAPVVKKLHEHRLVGGQKKISRVIVEKPFGRDLASAIELEAELSKYLKESEIFRIDHYLGKELIYNLLSFRFSNPLIESFWKSQFIDHVSITLSEEIGVGNRGAFWEETGLLRDLVQNHMMQIVSLVGMERPKAFTSLEIQNEKVRLIQAIRPLEASQVVRGQYGSQEKVPGYRQEKGVAANSSVETFVALKLFIDNPRWKNVPFYLKAGKRLAKKFTEIAIVFKSEDSSSVPNQLIFRVQPEEEIALIVNSSVPDLSHNQLESQPLTLPFKQIYGASIPDAYERLLYEAMLGDASHFVSFAELIASWRLMNPVLEYWKENPPLDFPNYPAGSEGPK